MSRKRIYVALLLAVLLAALSLGGVAAASKVASTDWWVIAGGGGHVEAGDYALDYTIGQGVAGTFSAGSYDLCVGFWCLGGKVQLYLPFVLQSS